MKKTTVFLIAAVVVVAVFVSMWSQLTDKNYRSAIQSFEQCARAGYPIMESYPRQCRTPDGKTFAEQAVSEVCRHQQECGGGYFCRFGVCTEFSPEISCQQDDDCQLIRNDYGFSCCYIGACMTVDYSENNWIAVKRDWFEQGRKQFCPSVEECGPAPMCPDMIKNGNYEAQCINNQCEKIAIIR